MPACLKESPPNIKASFYKGGFSEFFLTWQVNELSSLTIDCEVGQVVTNGTCRVPVTLKPGDLVEADFGVLGKVSCRFN